MASFTDQISQFNPYVSQLPIDAMVKVGMYKQQQYDQGVQKVQSYIDNVAGLDVYRDVDKTYLQSRLNDLGGKIKTVAAGDFSNQQLVNSVGGMASEIIKDEGIQNAVYSTANLKKQMQNIEASKAKGQWGVENEDLFNKQLSAYAKSTNLKDRFSSKYIPYTDVYKKLEDVAAKVGVDKSVIPDLWNRNEDGSYALDAKGNRSWNNIMLTKTIGGKGADKILTAFKAALTPQDYQQLSITGRYVNGGKNNEQLAQEITNNYSTQKEFAEGKLEDIKLQLFEEESKNKKDVDKIAQLNQKRDYYSNSLSSIDKAVKGQLENLERDPDAVRASLYTNDFLYNTSKGLSSIDEEYKYDVNPMFTVTMELNKFKETQQQNDIQNEFKRIDQALAAKNALTDAQYKQAELFYKYGVGSPPAGMGPKLLKEPLDIDKDGANAIVAQVQEDYTADLSRLNQVNYDLTTQWFKGVNPKKPGETDDQYDQRMAKAIKIYATGNKESVDPRSGDMNTFTARFAGKQLAEWNKGKDVPHEFRGLLDEQKTLTQDILAKKGQMQDAENKMSALAKERGLDVFSDKEIRAKVKPTTVTLANGQRVTLSKEDVIDYANMMPERNNIFGSLTVDKTQEAARTQSLNRQKLKWGDAAFSEIQKAVSNTTKNVQVSEATGFGELGAGYGSRLNPQVQEALGLVNDSKSRNRSKLLAEVYQGKGMVKQPSSMVIQRGKENKDDVNARVSSVLQPYAEMNSEIPNMQAAILADKSAIKVKVSPSSSGYKYEMIITGEKGQEYRQPISEQQYEYLGGAPLANAPVPRVISQIDTYGTSNMSGGTDSGSAWFGSNTFKNLTGANYTATGDLVTDKANKDKLWFKLDLHHKDGSTERLTYPDPFFKYNADGTLNNQLDFLSSGINKTVIEQIRNK
jgi:hypothetical protein